MHLPKSVRFVVCVYLFPLSLFCYANLYWSLIKSLLQATSCSIHGSWSLLIQPPSAFRWNAFIGVSHSLRESPVYPLLCFYHSLKQIHTLLITYTFFCAQLFVYRLPGILWRGGDGTWDKCDSLCQNVTHHSLNGSRLHGRLGARHLLSRSGPPFGKVLAG